MLDRTVEFSHDNKISNISTTIHPKKFTNNVESVEREFCDVTALRNANRRVHNH